MPVLLEASHLAAQEVGSRRFVLSNIDSGPFQLAATLMGMESAMTMLVENPREMKRVLEFCADVTIAYGAAMARTGCHGIQFGESTASLIGRKCYEELVFPEDRRVVAVLRKTGVKVFLHVCGDSTGILDLMAATGADCLEIDSKVDMAWAKKCVGRRLALKGNVDTVSFTGKPLEAFLDECRDVIEAGKDGGGFILCGGCEVPPDTTDETLHAFRRAADLYGTY
jgi:MtaA/CmuA family methyltransferase